jgi:hypothetical protein
MNTTIEFSIPFEFKRNYYTTENSNVIRRTVKLMIHNICWGRIDIIGPKFTKGGFTKENLNTIDISIDRPYRNYNFSRLLMREVLQLISMYEQISDTDILNIDTDITDGFWDYVGMSPNNTISIMNIKEFSNSLSSLEKEKLEQLEQEEASKQEANYLDDEYLDYYYD